MNEKYFHILAIAIAVSGFVLIGFLYISEPKSLAEVATKSQVALGTYEIDQAMFERGLESFRRDDFPSARTAFDRADPERRDATAQFYFAYSLYRQGWGRLSNDDALFNSGIAAVDRVLVLDPSFRTADTSLMIKTPIELRLELEQGLKITASDFNPLKLIRERK